MGATTFRPRALARALHRVRRDIDFIESCSGQTTGKRFSHGVYETVQAFDFASAGTNLSGCASSLQAVPEKT